MSAFHLASFERAENARTCEGPRRSEFERGEGEEMEGKEVDALEARACPCPCAIAGCFAAVEKPAGLAPDTEGIAVHNTCALRECWPRTGSRCLEDALSRVEDGLFPFADSQR